MLNIKDYIPQREPFLYLDKVLEISKEKVICETTFKEDLDFFKGHFPGNPIVPGVILSEASFQSGALLASYKKEGLKNNIAVVSRIQNAKFKNLVKPNEMITIETTILEEISNAVFFKTKVTSQAKTVLTIEFSCTLIEDQK